MLYLRCFSINSDSEQHDRMSHLKAFGSKSMPEHMLIVILVKKYLKYTLYALKIPMTSLHDTITIFTHQCMKKVDIKKNHINKQMIFKYSKKETAEPPSAVGRMSDYK